MTDPVTKYSYYHQREFRAILAGKEIIVCTKPGIPHSGGVSHASTLMAEKIRLVEGSHVALMGTDKGALAAVLSSQIRTGCMSILDTSILSQRLAAATLQKNGAENFDIVEDITLLPGKMGFFDAVVIELPKGRKLARRWLVEAWGLLSASGKLYLGGANDQGVQAVIKDAVELFGARPAILGYKKGNRVVQMVKCNGGISFPEWALEPGISPGSWREELADVAGQTFRIRTLPGVFSWEGLDEGTSLLLETVQPAPSKHALDFGCGSGIIGLWLSRQGAEKVTMVDANLLAVAAACENLALNQIKNARVFPSDGLEAAANMKFDLIVSNPPFHSGKEVDFEVTAAFIEHGSHLLESGGQLVVVANRFIRYDRLMQAYFPQVRCLCQTRKYHVIAATK
jgi:16S rRNA (guanine1207-N2)-methyltransferase